VDFSIYFYNQSGSITIEIDDEWTDAVLPPEDKTFQLTPFQVLPQLFFGFGWLVTLIMSKRL
jgi:hypothetical protein